MKKIKLVYVGDKSLLTQVSDDLWYEAIKARVEKFDSETRKYVIEQILIKLNFSQTSV